MCTKHTDNRARAELDGLEGHLEEQLGRVREVRALLARGERAAAVNLLRGHVYLDVAQLASVRIALDRAHERALVEY